MLKGLLESINNCNIDAELISFPIDIVVVDNDKDKTAEDTVLATAKEMKEIFNLYYHPYPIKGLANVRNELLNKALEKQPDYIVFIDDDEFATPDWLNELVSTITIKQGDFAMGPVPASFKEEPSRFLKPWFRHHDIENHSQVHFIETGNLIMSAKFIQKHNLRFDKRFNATGAEDSYFGIEALKNGAKIYFANKAIAYENIPESRVSLDWLLKRAYSGGNTFTYILRIENDYVGLVKKVIVNTVYLLWGALGLILMPFPVKNRYWGIQKIAESLGGFAGIFNLKYREYSKSRS